MTSLPPEALDWLRALSDEDRDRLLMLPCDQWEVSPEIAVLAKQFIGTLNAVPVPPRTDIPGIRSTPAPAPRPPKHQRD
jgi:hypothetical protein